VKKSSYLGFALGMSLLLSACQAGLSAGPPLSEYPAYRNLEAVNNHRQHPLKTTGEATDWATSL